MGWFCFCSGLSLRGVTRILKTVLPQTFTTGTWRCRCQWRFWNVYTTYVPSIQNGLKEHSPMQGGADGLGNPLPSPKWNCHFQSGSISPGVWSLVSVSAELSEEWLAFASEVCDPSRLQSQEHAEGQSPAARGSCYAVNDAIQMSPGGTMCSMLIHLKCHQQRKGTVKWEGQVDTDVILLSCKCSVILVK